MARMSWDERRETTEAAPEAYDCKKLLQLESLEELMRFGSYSSLSGRSNPRDVSANQGKDISAKHGRSENNTWLAVSCQMDS